MKARKPNGKAKAKGNGKVARERLYEGLCILNPPTLGSAEEVAAYLEGGFAATLRAVLDLVASGAAAECPGVVPTLLDDLAYVAVSAARVLRGEAAVEFADESSGFVEDLGRALKALAARIDGGDYENVAGGGDQLWDSTLPTLARLLGHAETVAAAEGRPRGKPTSAPKARAEAAR
jgi:hypothetical protein